jgi:hypothetical protein
MPDSLLILKAAAVAAVLAALALIAARPWRRSDDWWTLPSAALGAGLGWIAGACVLESVPHFPPQEGLDRLFVLLLPAAVAVEVTSAFLGRAAWALRAAVALAAARVLLHGSVYVSDSGGSEEMEWTRAETWLILGGLGLALIANWALLSRLAQRESGSAVLPALTLAAGGTGVTVMLSGYVSGGLLGLLLAAALAPAALAAFVFPRSAALRGALGVGVVGLFGLLIVGRFFAGLTTTNAALLFFAPLLGWLPEIPWVRRVGPRLGRVATTASAALAVAVVVTLAVQKFNADSRTSSETSGANEPTADDYLNFGK